MKLTDEQYEQVGIACGWAEEYAVEQGKRAMTAVAELLLVEPSIEECSGVGLSVAFGYPATRKLFANRLASVTAKPDPLREALSRWVSEGDMDEAIAAVDKARAK